MMHKNGRREGEHVGPLGIFFLDFSSNNGKRNYILDYRQFFW